MAQTLYELRQTQGLSREAIGERIGVSHTMVGRYERGTGEPRVTVGARYAEVLGITVAQLIELLGRGTDD